MVFFFFLPVPYLTIGGFGWAPLLRVGGTAALMVATGISDGVREPMDMFLGFLLVETLVLGVAVWFFAKLLLALIRRLWGDRFQTAAIVGFALILFAAALFPIYTTPTSSSGDQSSVFELLD